MKKFVLVGAAGYIAPRHLHAIKETGNTLAAAMDISDSVGILDSYFPDAEFFTEFDELDAYIKEQQQKGCSFDFMVICSPNNLHMVHIKSALMAGLDVICEKPLVLSESELLSVKACEDQYSGKVNSILQLRLHPAIISLKQRLPKLATLQKHDVSLTYITSRGKWYDKSWKGDNEKSGGVATNIGIHFFDMLSYLFGEVLNIQVHFKSNQTVSGSLELERASVAWFLSTEEKFLPSDAVRGEKLTFRSINVDGDELEFSGGFTDLHTRSYQKILANEGFGVADNLSAIKIAENVRISEVEHIKDACNPHSFMKNMKKNG